MATKVFANGRKIACKKAEGKSLGAFPDVCFTPPQTPATPGGVPVPYPNTGYAKDTAKGSKTVKIGGKPVMLKDKSYFKQSTGDEAGAAAQKGVVSGVNRGKVQFVSWSMNVKIEGKNVVRHLDLTTHNHGSVPGNTGTWAYIDSGIEERACGRDKARVERNCEPTEQQGRGKRAKEVPNRRRGAWKKSYCKALKAPAPAADDYDPADIEERLDELLDIGKRLEDALQGVTEILVEKAGEWAAKQAGKLIAKTAIKGWLGPIGWVWTIYDVATTAIEIKEMWDIIDEMREDLKTLEQLPEEIERIRKQGLEPATLADAQAAFAMAIPCLRARKCMLVPFKAKYQSRPYDWDSGCCPGQTAHHLIPKFQFKNAADCPGYDPDKAPCVCVEGTSDSRGGSHQKLHELIDGQIEDAADKQGQMSYRQAKKIALESHQELFEYCDRRCIEAQLDDYYKEACGRQGEDFRIWALPANSSKRKDPNL